MEVETLNNPFPHLLLENVFTDNQLDSIWKELNFLKPSLNTDTSPAIDKEGFTLKKNSGIFPYFTYRDPTISPICRLLKKLSWECGLGDLWSQEWIKNTYSATNWDSVLVSYYDNKDYYRAHFDSAMFTMLIWLWQEPKKFDGGNLYFPDAEHVVMCKHNCGIIFLSGEKHGVQPIELHEEGAGRYCISMFSGINSSFPSK